MAGCGEDLSVATQGDASEAAIANDVPFAYVQRSLNNSTGDASPFAYHAGAQLIVRERVSSSAADKEVLSAALQSAEYDVKDLNVSPNGRFLIFAARTAQSSWNLFEYDFTTGGTRRIIADDGLANAGHDTNPAYTQDGHVVFSSTRHLGTDAQTSSVLFSMTREGDDIEQLTTGTVYDYKPATLKDGSVVFMRISQGGEIAVCDNSSVIGKGLNATDCAVNNQKAAVETTTAKKYSLLRLRSESSEVEEIASGEVAQNSQEALLELKNVMQGSDGHLLALVKHQQNNFAGGDVVTLNGGEVGNTVYAELSPVSYTGAQVNLYPTQVSLGGWYSAFWPYRDGSQRMLISWSQCIAEQSNLAAPCNNNTSTSTVNARYGVWVFDAASQTRQPVILAKAGVVYTDLALAYPSQAGNLNFAPVVVKPVDPTPIDPSNPTTPTDPTNPTTPTDPTNPITPTDPTNPTTPTDPTNPTTPTDPTNPTTPTDPTNPTTPTDPTNPTTPTDPVVEVPTPGACYAGQGYWKNHNKYAANPSQQYPWPVLNSGIDTEDTSMCALTWLGNLNTQPRGDAWVILSHQFIAAKLNEGNGAFISGTIANALSRASSLLQQCNISAAQRDEAIALSELLDDFNNDQNCEYTEPTSPLQSDYGVVNIRSIYDLDGVDKAIAIAPTGIRALADPSEHPMDNRSERFIRVLGVEQYGDQHVEKLLGYADVQPDGSAMFKVPANREFTFEVVNANLKAINNKSRDYAFAYLQKHPGTLQVNNGAEMQCHGCHEGNTGSAHGTAASINLGASQINQPFTNTNPSILPRAVGQTMAEVLMDYLADVPVVKADVEYRDIWTHRQCFTPSADINYHYAALETPAPAAFACLTEWDASCDAQVDYLSHIQPIWEKSGRDSANRSCVNCHDNSGATGLNLTHDGIADSKTTVTSFRELFSARATYMFLANEFNAVNVSHCRRQETLPFVSEPSNDCFTCYQRVLMSEQGAIESANFFELFDHDQDDAAWLFNPQNMSPRVNHQGMLSADEQRVISEWLDRGAPL
jgi:hypothetical protein